MLLEGTFWQKMLQNVSDKRVIYNNNKIPQNSGIEIIIQVKMRESSNRYFAGEGRLERHGKMCRFIGY